MFSCNIGLPPSAGFAPGDGGEDSGFGCSSDHQTFVSPTEQLSVGSVLTFIFSFLAKINIFLVIFSDNALASSGSGFSTQVTIPQPVPEGAQKPCSPSLESNSYQSSNSISSCD